MYSSIQINAIPNELKQHRQWILWAKQPGENGKIKKVPHSPLTARRINAHDPQHWVSFTEAVEKLEEHMLDGIGFVFTDDDPFVGIDLDHCLDNDGEMTDEKAKRILELANSYNETSPSGTGAKIFGKTSRKTLPNGQYGRKNGDYEIYVSRRFFTITGWGTDEIREIDDVIDEIFKLIDGDDKAQNSRRARLPENELYPRASSDTEPLDDKLIIDKIRQNPKGKSLWKGQTSAYKSDSEADLALCGLIAKYSGNQEQIDRIFMESGLYRPKWDEDRCGITYGEMTIEKALANAEKYWKTSGLKNVSKPLKTAHLGFFKWEFFDYIIKGTGDFDVMSEIIDALKGCQDRELYDFLFRNLAVYIKKCSAERRQETDQFIDNATRFIENIGGDPASLKKWLNLYDERVGSNEELDFTSEAVLGWAARQFPGTIIYKLIKDDADRLFLHRAYFSFIERNMTGNSVEEMRAQWNDFVEKNIDKPGSR